MIRVPRFPRSARRSLNCWLITLRNWVLRSYAVKRNSDKCINSLWNSHICLFSNNDNPVTVTKCAGTATTWTISGTATDRSGTATCRCSRVFIFVVVPALFLSSHRCDVKPCLSLRVNMHQRTLHTRNKPGHGRQQKFSKIETPEKIFKIKKIFNFDWSDFFNEKSIAASE